MKACVNFCRGFTNEQLRRLGLSHHNGYSGLEYLVDALAVSTTQLVDLDSGYQRRDLSEPLEETLRRNRGLLIHDLGIDDEGAWGREDSD